MAVAELITEAERLVKESRDSFTQGFAEVAKDKLWALAGKIVDELPGIPEKPAQTPGQSQF